LYLNVSVFGSSNFDTTFLTDLGSKRRVSKNMLFLQKVQFWKFFILLQEGPNAQQRAYLYKRTLN